MEAMAATATPQGSPMMTLPEAVKQVLKKYADFSGRATRAEYWWWVLATLIVGMAIGSVDAFIASIVDKEWISSPLATIFNLAILLPNLAVSARRLHDIGKSGWWLLVWFVLVVIGWIPVVVGLILLLVGGALKGQFDAGSFVPLIIGGAITLLLALGLLLWIILWMVRQGQGGPNRFGPDPRATAGTEPLAAPDALA